jgi:hypothetical protein
MVPIAQFAAPEGFGHWLDPAPGIDRYNPRCQLPIWGVVQVTVFGVDVDAEQVAANVGV